MAQEVMTTFDVDKKRKSWNDKMIWPKSSQTRMKSSQYHRMIFIPQRSPPRRVGTRARVGQRGVWARKAAAAKKSAALKASIDSVQRSGLSEEDVLVRVGALRQEQKTIKNDRNAFVAGFLSPLQQMALDSILNPPAPSIQHFGFHDRLKCLVCKKPNEGAMFPSGVKSPDQLMTPKQ